MESGATTTISVSIDHEAMSRPAWRSMQSRYVEGLAARLVTRGDLLRLVAETDREMTAENLAHVIGSADYEDAKREKGKPRLASVGAKIGADYVTQARIHLDPTRDRDEELKHLSTRQRAAIVDAFGPVAWRL